MNTTTEPTTPDLYYQVHAGTGPYLLLVHGFLSSQAQWMLNLAALSQVTRPVVVELWGHGRSPSPAESAWYYPDTYIGSFERLRQRLGVERWLVCGQSFGAALTIRYALRYPHRVMAQIFTNSSSALADAEWAATRRASAMQQAASIEREGIAALEKIPVHPLHARRLPSEVRDALVQDARLHHPYGIAQMLRYATPNVPIRDRVKDNQVPTLLVCGEREKRFSTRRAFVEQAMPHLQVIGTPAGHAVNIEAAAAFNDAVLDFIAPYI